MMTEDERFKRELEVFRTEEEAGTQFFYAYLAVHAVAYEKKDVHALLNTAPLFWNTCMGALQTAAFIALGRVFDQDSPHNIDMVLRIARDNPQIFSKAALGRRKQGNSAERPNWLDEYLSDAYEPNPKDFRRLRAHVKRRRRIYESSYREVRNKFFAHKAVSDHAEATVLFGKGTNRELQQLFTFLSSLHQALWQLFYNGRKPVLRPLRYSVERMRDLPSPAPGSGAIQSTSCVRLSNSYCAHQGKVANSKDGAGSARCLLRRRSAGHGRWDAERRRVNFFLNEVPAAFTKMRAATQAP